MAKSTKKSKALESPDFLRIGRALAAAYSVNADDLIQEIALALLRSRRFDPGREDWQGYARKAGQSIAQRLAKRKAKLLAREKTTTDPLEEVAVASSEPAPVLLERLETEWHRFFGAFAVAATRKVKSPEEMSRRIIEFYEHFQPGVPLEAGADPEGTWKKAVAAHKRESPQRRRDRKKSVEKLFSEDEHLKKLR